LLYFDADIVREAGVVTAPFYITYPV